MNTPLRLAPMFVVLALLPAAVAGAQDAPPAPPPPTWTGSFGAGFALTNGNTNTSNSNFSFKVVRDPKTRMIFSAAGLLIRGSKNGELSADNSLFNTKLERKVADKGYVFGQLVYLRDSFKSIDYFVAPTAGLGIPFYNTANGSFSADLSVGASFEKNPDKAVQTHTVVAFGEKFTRALSKTASFTHAFSGNVVANDLGDGLYTTSVGISASVTTHTQMKVEVLNTYRTTTPNALINRSDVSTVFSFVYRF